MFRLNLSRFRRLSLLLSCAFFACASIHAASVETWLSSEDGSRKLTQGVPLSFEKATRKADDVITLDPAVTYQDIVGIGSSLEHATCFNLSKLTPELREATIEKLVDPVKGIGMNHMRICIGTPDFTGDPWYSYDEVDPGETDFGLQHFSIEKDRAYVLPILKQVLEKNPEILFVASPWSPPAWMKTNGSMLSGELRSDCYEVFAKYLVAFVKAYEAEGIPLYAITPQNEPDYPNPEYPTCYWSGEMQRDFIREYLGPEMEKAGIHTKLWCWDHNWNLLDFPRAVLKDPAAARFVDGVGFHHYEGRPGAQSELHHEFPDKHIYFTEGSTFRVRGAVTIIEILRNWSRTYNAWVIMLDTARKPNNGPHSASQTSLELLDDGSVAYHFDYYMYGHFSKFIQRGAYRVESGESTRNFAQVAFKNPDGSLVLIVANPGLKAKTIGVESSGQTFATEVPGHSIITCRWLPGGS